MTVPNGDAIIGDLSKATPSSVARTLEGISGEIMGLWWHHLENDDEKPDDPYMKWLMQMASDCSMAAQFIRVQAMNAKKGLKNERQARAAGADNASG